MKYVLTSPVAGVTVQLTNNPCNAKITLTEEAKKEMERLLLEDDYEDWVVKHIVEAVSEEHVGDCTCVPASCSRCHAESALGLNTFPFSKHVGHALSEMAFQAYASEEDKAEHAKVVAELAEKYPSKMSQEDQSSWALKWAENRALAKEAWDNHLLLYKQQKTLSI